MIIHLILSVVTVFANILTSWLPDVEVLPLGLDPILNTAVGYFNGVTETLPYLNVVWQCFLYILSFEILLLVLKIFLGSRVPTHNIN